MIPADVRVRPRLAGDTRAVRRVARATWRATYRGKVPDGFIRAILRRGYDRRRLVAGLADARRDAFVAELSGRVVGYADVVEEAPLHVELVRIYVLPFAQGTGLGRALLAAALGAARRRGATRLDVAVEPENDRALRWYEAQGFRRDGTAEFVLGPWTRPQVRLSLPLG